MDLERFIIPIIYHLFLFLFLINENNQMIISLDFLLYFIYYLSHKSIQLFFYRKMSRLTGLKMLSLMSWSKHLLHIVDRRIFKR
jgi:hypothetical protein